MGRNEANQIGAHSNRVAIGCGWTVCGMRKNLEPTGGGGAGESSLRVVAAAAVVVVVGGRRDAVYLPTGQPRARRRTPFLCARRSDAHKRASLLKQTTAHCGRRHDNRPVYF